MINKYFIIHVILIRTFDQKILITDGGLDFPLELQPMNYNNILTTVNFEIGTSYDNNKK